MASSTAPPVRSTGPGELSPAPALGSEGTDEGEPIRLTSVDSAKAELGDSTHSETPAAILPARRSKPHDQTQPASERPANMPVIPKLPAVTPLRDPTELNNAPVVECPSAVAAPSRPVKPKELILEPPTTASALVPESEAQPNPGLFGTPTSTAAAPGISAPSTQGLEQPAQVGTVAPAATTSPPMSTVGALRAAGSAPEQAAAQTPPANPPVLNLEVIPASATPGVSVPSSEPSTRVSAPRTLDESPASTKPQTAAQLAPINPPLTNTPSLAVADTGIPADQKAGEPAPPALAMIASTPAPSRATTPVQDDVADQALSGPPGSPIPTQPGEVPHRETEAITQVAASLPGSPGVVDELPPLPPDLGQTGTLTPNRSSESATQNYPGSRARTEASNDLSALPGESTETTSASPIISSGVVAQAGPNTPQVGGLPLSGEPTFASERATRLENEDSTKGNPLTGQSGPTVTQPSSKTESLAGMETQSGPLPAATGSPNQPSETLPAADELPALPGATTATSNSGSDQPYPTINPNLESQVPTRSSVDTSTTSSAAGAQARNTSSAESSGELVLPDRLPLASSLRPEQQREVEEIARRQEDELRQRLQTPTQGTPLSRENTNPSDLRTQTQLDISRAPSPAEARPIKAIPVPEDWVPLAPRNWAPQRKYWAAAATCHLPLYFQDPVLERYGHSIEQFVGPAGRFLTYPVDDPTQSTQRNQIFQPLFSWGLFGLQIIAWPYNLIMDPPWEAQYDLGYYRPGDNIPTDLYWLPLHGYGPPLHGNSY